MKYTNKPFNNLRLVPRAVFILRLACFSNTEIEKVCHLSKRSVIRHFKAGKAEYPDSNAV